jgi:hypothetical protein
MLRRTPGLFKHASRYPASWPVSSITNQPLSLSLRIYEFLQTAPKPLTRAELFAIAKQGGVPTGHKDGTLTGMARGVKEEPWVLTSNRLIKALKSLQRRRMIRARPADTYDDASDAAAGAASGTRKKWVPLALEDLITTCPLLLRAAFSRAHTSTPLSTN